MVARTGRERRLLDLLEAPECTLVQAPMVRYSKLPFRLLCRKWGTQILFTPMIIADSFNNSQICRDIEFTTTADDQPLVVQFAASNAADLVAAVEKVAPYCDGVDLNCGCPQRWAMKEGYGSRLITRPELLRDMIRQAAASTGTPVSVKIRIHDDLRETVDLARNLEAVGAAFLTVHGRTAAERTTVPVHWDAIKLVKDSVGIPVIANGDVTTWAEVEDLHRRTGANGVMAARGLLENPALFGGHDVTPVECIKDYVDLATQYGTLWKVAHHHLAQMTISHFTRPERLAFYSCKSISGALDFLRGHFGDDWPAG